MAGGRMPGTYGTAGERIAELLRRSDVPLGTAAIIGRLSLSRSMVFRHLTALEEQGRVARDGPGGRGGFVWSWVGEEKDQRAS